MQPKEIKYSSEAREKILAGANKLANAVRATLGPRGRNVMIDNNHGMPGMPPRITKDGVTVAKQILLYDRFENMGAQTLREVASKACDKAGDGTTTATVLAQSIFNEGAKAVAAGMNPMDLKRGIDIAVAAAVENIKSRAKQVNGEEDWKKIATVSANGDTEVGEKVAEAVKKVGREGVVTVEEAKGLDFELEVVEGMQFDRGYLSPYFVTDQEKMQAEFENPYILIFDKKLSHLQPIVPLLEATVNQQKALLLIVEEIDNEPLSLLVINRMRAGMRVCAVKAPGFGDRRKEMLRDLAVLTGGEVIDDQIGQKLETLTTKALGKAKKVTIDREHTTVVGGQGNAAAIKEHCDSLRKRIEEEQSDYARDFLKQRLAKLTSGVAVLKVGGTTETEMKERRDRVEDALHATRAAIEEGIVPGGGTALLYAMESISLMPSTIKNRDQEVGVEIIRKALQAPIRQIAENAGQDGSAIVGKLLDADKYDSNIGYDAQNLVYCNMVEAGIVDPAKVVRVALQDAASVASLLITTEVLITDRVEEKKEGR